MTVRNVPGVGDVDFGDASESEINRILQSQAFGVEKARLAPPQPDVAARPGVGQQMTEGGVAREAARMTVMGAGAIPAGALATTIGPLGDVVHLAHRAYPTTVPDVPSIGGYPLTTHGIVSGLQIPGYDVPQNIGEAAAYGAGFGGGAALGGYAVGGALAPLTAIRGMGIGLPYTVGTGMVGGGLAESARYAHPEIAGAPEAISGITGLASTGVSLLREGGPVERVASDLSNAAARSGHPLGGQDWSNIRMHNATRMLQESYTRDLAANRATGIPDPDLPNWLGNALTRVDPTDQRAMGNLGSRILGDSGAIQSLRAEYPNETNALSIARVQDPYGIDKFNKMDPVDQSNLMPDKYHRAMVQRGYAAPATEPRDVRWIRLTDQLRSLGQAIGQFVPGSETALNVVAGVGPSVYRPLARLLGVPGLVPQTLLGGQVGR